MTWRVGDLFRNVMEECGPQAFAKRREEVSYAIKLFERCTTKSYERLTDRWGSRWCRAGNEQNAWWLKRLRLQKKGNIHNLQQCLPVADVGVECGVDVHVRRCLSLPEGQDAVHLAR